MEARWRPGYQEGPHVPPPRQRRSARGTSGTYSAVVFDVDLFKGTFSFDDFFNILVGDVLLDVAEEGKEPTPDGTLHSPEGGPKLAGFPEAENLLPIFRDARRELIELSRQMDARLLKLKKEVAAQDAEHKETLAKLERGVEGLNDSFERLDNRISGVGHTAARIGDHLQSADAQREVAIQTIELIKYLMEFNSGRGDLLQFAPPAAVFSDDKRMGEAAAIAQKLRSLAEEDDTDVAGHTQATPGLEVAVAHLREYCSDLENKLLARFDLASQKRDLAMMAECAKILEQFQRGSQAIQRYVATRPMFLDVEVMQSDIHIALGENTISSLTNNSTPARGLQTLYKEIVDTMQLEADTVAAVFPSPKAVMAQLVKRVMLQRVQNVLEAMLPQPDLNDPPAIEEGGLLLHLRTLAAAFEKTMELAKDLQKIGCGDTDVEGTVQRELFAHHLDIYHELEQKSLMQLFHAKYLEANQNGPSVPEASPTAGPLAPAGRPAGLSRAANIGMDRNSLMPIGVVSDCVRWNEEAIARCKLLSAEAVQLVENVQMVFGVLLDQVSVYTMLGLEKAQKALADASALRDKFSIGTRVSSRVAAAAAAAAEQAAVAGEQGVRIFMNAVKRASSNVAAVHVHFVGTVARLLLPVDGAQAQCLEELARKMQDAEGLALRGLQTCMDTSIAEVDRLLQAEQKAADFKPPEDGAPTDHRPTRACIQVVAYLERLVECVQSCLEGPNKQAFLADLGNRLHKALIIHIQKFNFNLSGGLRLKRDVSEYADFVRSFKTPATDERFEGMGTLVNLFIVAPDGLPALVDSSHLRREEAMSFIQLREDFRSAKIASIFGM